MKELKVPLFVRDVLWKLRYGVTNRAIHGRRVILTEKDNLPLFKFRLVELELFQLFKVDLLGLKFQRNSLKEVKGIQVSVEEACKLFLIEFFVLNDIRKLEYAELRLLIDAYVLSNRSWTLFAAQFLGEKTDQTCSSLMSLFLHFGKEKSVTLFTSKYNEQLTSITFISFFGIEVPISHVFCSDLSATCENVDCQWCPWCDCVSNCHSTTHNAKCDCKKTIKDFDCENHKTFRLQKTTGAISAFVHKILMEILHADLRMYEHFIFMIIFIAFQWKNLDSINKIIKTKLFDGKDELVIDIKPEKKTANKNSIMPSDFFILKGSENSRFTFVNNIKKVIHLLFKGIQLNQSNLQHFAEAKFDDMTTKRAALWKGSIEKGIECNHKRRYFYYRHKVGSSAQFKECRKKFLSHAYKMWDKTEQTQTGGGYSVETLKEIFMYYSRLLTMVLNLLKYGFGKERDVQTHPLPSLWTEMECNRLEERDEMVDIFDYCCQELQIIYCFLHFGDPTGKYEHVVGCHSAQMVRHYGPFLRYSTSSLERKNGEQKDFLSSHTNGLSYYDDPKYKNLDGPTKDLPLTGQERMLCEEYIVKSTLLAHELSISENYESI